MSCRAKFTFVKGPCLGKVIIHDFDRDATVSQMKQYLVQVHRACDPSSQSLTFVWEEQCRKITDDDQAASSFGAIVSITVSTIKKLSASHPVADPVTASLVSTVGSNPTSASTPPSPPAAAALVPQSVDHALSLPPTSSIAPTLGTGISVLDARDSHSNADSPKSVVVDAGLESSDIVIGIGRGAGVLEAKMQLELPQGSRSIKCYAGCSLRDLQSALSDFNLMSVPGQQLVKVGVPHVQLPLDTPLASLNRSRLHIIACPSAANGADLAATTQQKSAPSVPAETARSCAPPTLNESVGIDAAELERRKMHIAAEQRKREEDRKRILAAHDQEQKDKSLQKQMALDKLIADNAKARLAASSHVAGSQITLGVCSPGAMPSKVRIGTAKGGIEVICYDETATLGTLRAILVSRGLCTQEAPIILTMQQ